MNYEEMMDLEINKAVAEKLGFEVIEFRLSNNALKWMIKEPMGDDWIPAKIPNYCTDPSAAWPIIVENKISIGWTDKVCGWTTFASGDGFFCRGVNPLRAAMIVFLMMKVSE